MQLPVYTHPTLTVLIDDSDSFLKSLAFQLDPGLARKTFRDTSSALHWLRHSTQPGETPLHVNFDTQNLPPDQCNVALDLERIWRISGQAQRFAVPSVLVVDYSMPQMNGLEFCQAVRDLPCKKILFTGAADEKVAVTAFNRGLIDRYIKKSDDDALDILEQEIHALQREFFLQQSDTVRDLLLLHDYSFLQDEALAAVVYELCQRQGYVEFYIFPNPSGILFFTRDGHAKLMIIETERSLHTQYEMARDSDAPASLLLALLELRVIPYFSDADSDGMYAAHIGENWFRYCAAPTICLGQVTYFWALFDVPPHQLGQPVMSYAQFLRAQAGESVGA
ncbi:response regulator receiver domain-containing protein [Janthinobacterium sp. 61]|uniref:response regulator n=1 Tax=Janthinobacterium sp. 61 TaxID=2035209 RepID=UPI000C710143|nr:response regulator [Janthinobacterium sp. 61]PKV45519.1 response regulator receiver domain-containing protein [Janthinobacterium sp. 61]